MFAVTSAVLGQNFGSQTSEFHMPVPIQKCSKSGGCSSESTMATLDSNWRWTHQTGTIKNCYTGNVWDTSLCPDVSTCTENCAVDGVDEKTWSATYGILSDKQGMVNMSFVTNGTYSRNVGSRVYLMDDDDNYKMFKLVNKEFTFDVDVSNMPCGLNGAVYFVEMDKDGGKSKYNSNKAGAKLGTGYCDAQCPHDLKWINGEANIIGWNSSSSDPNAGTGKFGTCCAELDIWEANKISTQMTVHSCETEGQYRCEGTECGDNQRGERFKGVCDKDGCDQNPYRVGDTTFFGPGSNFKVDSTKPMTVVTQFISSDGTDNGDLVEMRRLYVQNGKVIANANAGNSYGAKYDSITDEMCDVQKKLFTDINDYEKKGGIKSMGEAMKRGMTLVMSMWDDHDVGMIWLDAVDPYPVPAGKKGAPRGTCSQDSGAPKTVEDNFPHSHVLYSNIKYGEIGSTFAGGPSPPSPSPSSCPGGTLSACIALCPSAPPTAYKACVESCVQRCSTEIEAYESGLTDKYR
jgi:cellulose 1,4-beta-cellobiosidase